MKKRLMRWLEMGLGTGTEDEWDGSMRLGARSWLAVTNQRLHVH